MLRTRSCRQSWWQSDCRQWSGSMIGSRCGRAARGSRAHCPRGSSDCIWSRCCRGRRTPQSCPRARTHTSSPSWSAAVWRAPCWSCTSPTRSACRPAMPRPDCGSSSRCPSAWHRFWPSGRAVYVWRASVCGPRVLDSARPAAASCHMPPCVRPLNRSENFTYSIKTV